MLEAIVGVAVAFLLSVVGTKGAHPLGLALGIVDQPGERKVHNRPMPRSGGLVLIPVIVASLALVAWLYPGSQLASFITQPQMAYVIAGLAVVYVLGFLDDKFQLNAVVKLLAQVVAVTIPYLGGVRIEEFNLFLFPVTMEWELLSYLVTLFWGILIMNAINLIDGLDGLASGIILFTSLVIACFSLFSGQTDLLVFYAVMSGAVAGFLVYNFNPATIFLGDCGSYSLGYIVGMISLISETKSQLGTSLALPLITLGVPVFDAIISGVRRFISGRSPFSADREHIHHRLLDLGLTHRRSVFILYGLTVVFACLSFFAIVGTQRLNDVAIVLAIVLLAICFKKLKYFEELAIDRVYGWFRDVVDVTGISQTRRSFLGLQHGITQADNLEEVWESITLALDFIGMDYAEANLCVRTEDRYRMRDGCSASDLSMGEVGCEAGEPANSEREVVRFFWSGEGFDLTREQQRRGLMKMECPLVHGGYSWGTLWLVKDLKVKNLDQFTLRRIEQLRRNLIAKINDLNGIKS